MKRWNGIAAMLACVLLAGCTAPPAPDTPRGTSSAARPAESTASEAAAALSAQTPEALTPAQLLDTVNEAHRAVEKPQIDFAASLQASPGDDFNIHNYGEGPEFNPEAILTQEQAAEDAELLFRALRTTYGPYASLGGDAVFTPAKEAVLAECAGQEQLTARFFSEALVRNLAFLGDGHFQINGEGLSRPYLGYFYSGTPYLKTAAGFVTLDGGRTVESVDGYDDPDALFRMSLSEAGEVVWHPVVMLESTGDLTWKPDDLTIRYTDGTSETLSAAPWESYYEKSDRLVDLQYSDDIPVLFVRNMGFNEAKGDEIGRQFLELGEKVKDEPALIIDLRSNGGGNSLLPLEWLQDYAGQFVPTNYQGLMRWSMQDMLDYSKNTDNPYYNSLETMTGLAGYEPVSETYMACFPQSDAFIPNDRLLILLTGKNTASAAETFTDAVRNLENTLVIGQNTYGMLVSNAYTVMVLPNSGTAVQLGSDLNFFPEGDFEEFKGFQPDLWVGGDAQKAAVEFVKRWKASGES